LLKTRNKPYTTTLPVSKNQKTQEIEN
jgi:hypothetical protein